MTIVSDSYVIDSSVSEFICISFSGCRDTGVGLVELKAPLWLERSNLRWLIESVRSCLSPEGPLRCERKHGQDDLIVNESGPEQEPCVNVSNVRPADAPHGGTYWYGMGQPLARKLVGELEALLESSSSR